MVRESQEKIDRKRRSANCSRGKKLYQSFSCQRFGAGIGTVHYVFTSPGTAEFVLIAIFSHLTNCIPGFFLGRITTTND
jgi:hypothetical protein